MYPRAVFGDSFGGLYKSPIFSFNNNF